MCNSLNYKELEIGQTGFEPATSTSRTSRATNCAIARCLYKQADKIKKPSD